MQEETQQNSIQFSKAICEYIGFGSQSPNYEKAFSMFKQIYETTGSKEAAFWLAKCYQLGHGTQKQFAVANELFIIATRSEENDVRSIAQYYISQNYRLRRGVENINDDNFNNLIANMYLVKSAKNGFAVAQYEVGARYLFGIGVPQDVRLGIRFLSVSANPTSAKITANSFNIIGYAQSQQLLGWCYKKGFGVNTIDIEKAIAYLHSASLKDNMSAKYEIGENLEDSALKKEIHSNQVAYLKKREALERKPATPKFY